MAHKQRTVMADINMVPFIDITLILLIIFMVMSPLLVQMQLTVDLPKSQAINTQAEDDVIRVEVQKDGTISVMNKKLTMRNLERELILRMGKASKKTILVQADKDVPIQQVVDVFDVAKNSAPLNWELEYFLKTNEPLPGPFQRPSRIGRPVPAVVTGPFRQEGLGHVYD